MRVATGTTNLENGSSQVGGNPDAGETPALPG